MADYLDSSIVSGLIAGIREERAEKARRARKQRLYRAERKAREGAEMLREYIERHERREYEEDGPHAFLVGEDTGAVPKGFHGAFLAINDHGNCSLYHIGRNGHAYLIADFV